MIERGKCLNCEAEQADLDGICCKCGWNCREGRLSTEEEMAPVREKLDRAIEQLNKLLEGK